MGQRRLSHRTLGAGPSCFAAGVEACQKLGEFTPAVWEVRMASSIASHVSNCSSMSLISGTVLRKLREISEYHYKCKIKLSANDAIKGSFVLIEMRQGLPAVCRECCKVPAADKLLNASILLKRCGKLCSVCKIARDCCNQSPLQEATHV